MANKTQYQVDVPFDTRPQVFQISGQNALGDRLERENFK